MSSPNFAYHGTLIHTPSLGTLSLLQNTLITISCGEITAITPNISKQDTPDVALTHDVSPQNITYLRPGQFLIPGFIDTHNHAPQWNQRGLGQGMQILDWLEEVTFPNEARFRDVEFARGVYSDLVKGMLRQGVTSASYYGSLHAEATCELVDIIVQKGQRAVVGKCNMDRNSPSSCCDASVEQSMQDTLAVLRHVDAKRSQSPYLNYVITPRFAISCRPELLQALGRLATDRPDLAIQTHFNEARQEIDATRALFPQFGDEVELYVHYGLLKPRTILAHCTVMTDSETARLAALGCGIAHCPTANMTVGGGFMAAPVRDFLSRGMKVGLGTDSGGGFSSSVLDAMRHALIASFAREAATGGREKGLSLEEVFYLATAGGAEVMGLGDLVGRFVSGKQFDAVLVDMNVEGGINAPVEDTDDERRVFDKFLMTGDDRNMVRVYVAGNLVHSL